MGTAASVPTTAKKAKAAGFTQKQINEYIVGGNAVLWTRSNKKWPDGVVGTVTGAAKKPGRVRVQVGDQSFSILIAELKLFATGDKDDANHVKPDANASEEGGAKIVAPAEEGATSTAASADAATAGGAAEEGASAAAAKAAAVATAADPTTEPAPAAPAPAPAVAPTLEEAQALFAGDPPDTTRKIKIFYSHYSDEFECRAGVLRWRDLDDGYAISFVFKGNFEYALRRVPKGMTNNKPAWKNQPLLGRVIGKEGFDPETNERSSGFDDVYFWGFDNYPGTEGEEIWLEVKESDVGLNDALGKREFVSFSANGEEDPFRGKRKEGCSCLYGNPCVDKYICNDWANRFKIAKANS